MIATKSRRKSLKKPVAHSKRPVVLKTPDEAETYVAENLKPAGKSPSGLPFYRHKDLKKLDLRFVD